MRDVYELPPDVFKWVGSSPASSTRPPPPFHHLLSTLSPFAPLSQMETPSSIGFNVSLHCSFCSTFLDGDTIQHCSFCSAFIDREIRQLISSRDRGMALGPVVADVALLADVAEIDIVALLASIAELVDHVDTSAEAGQQHQPGRRLVAVAATVTEQLLQQLLTAIQQLPSGPLNPRMAQRQVHQRLRLVRLVRQLNPQQRRLQMQRMMQAQRHLMMANRRTMQ